VVTKDLLIDVDNSDNSKEDNQAEGLLRTEPKLGPPRLDLRKPRIIEEEDKIVSSEVPNEEKVRRLKPLYLRALQENDIRAQDRLLHTLIGLGGIKAYEKKFSAVVNDVYSSVGVKDAFEREVSDVNEDCIYAHVTAMGTVNLEDNGFYIKPECAKYVNTNGDSWEKGLVVHTINSYLEKGLNYIEHVQVPYFAKGRPVDILLKDVGDSLYVDLLIEIQDEETAQKVINGEYNSCSIGCSYSWAVCSKCGQRFSPVDARCSHLDFHLRQNFTDENGIERVIAEVLRERDGGTVYTDISWVANPAFKPAVLHDVLIPEIKTSAVGISLSELVSMGNMINIGFMLPIIRQEPDAKKRIFYIAITYFVLKSKLSFLKKLLVLKLVTKFPIPTVAGFALYMRRLSHAAGVGSKYEDEMKKIVRNVRFQLR